MKKRTLFMGKMFFPITLLLIAGFITGCGPRNLATGAENVRIIPNTAYIPISCKFLGEVSGIGVHGDMSLEASPPELALDDVHFLKNEGQKLGANVVVLKQHQFVEKRLSSYGKRPRNITVIRHNIIGNSYLCPSATLRNK